MDGAEVEIPGGNQVSNAWILDSAETVEITVGKKLDHSTPQQNTTLNDLHIVIIIILISQHTILKRIKYYLSLIHI